MTPVTGLVNASTSDYAFVVFWNGIMFAIASVCGQWMMSRLYRPLIASHPPRAAAHGGDPCAGHLHEPDRHHHRDETLDLVGGAGQLEHEGGQRRVDRPGAEGGGKPSSRQAQGWACRSCSSCSGRIFGAPGTGGWPARAAKNPETKAASGAACPPPGS